jgi:Glycosyltransferase family 87
LDPARRAGTHSLAIWAPLTVAWVLVVAYRQDALAFDFHHAYLPAGRAVLHGISPYPAVSEAALAPRTAYVYPPLTAFLAAPFTVFPPLFADILVSLLAIGCVVLILRVLGVRDWRCYMIAFLWLPTYAAIQTANVTLLIALGLALIWRYRGRAVVLSFVVGFLIALKLFLWPLLLWLVATRRYRAAGGGAVTAVGLIALPWAVIGFSGLAQYPGLLGTLSRLQRTVGYTVAALLEPAVPWRTAQIVGLALGLAVLFAAVAAGRRDDRKSLTLTVAAVLLLSPIVSLHYFVILLAVVALNARRFGPIWVLPLLFWISPQVENGAEWQTGAALIVAAAVFLLALVSDNRRSSRSRLNPEVPVPA